MLIFDKSFQKARLIHVRAAFTKSVSSRKLYDMAVTKEKTKIYFPFMFPMILRSNPPIVVLWWYLSNCGIKKQIFGLSLRCLFWSVIHFDVY